MSEMAHRDLWRIESPDGMGLSTQVSLNGTPLTNVIAASISVSVDGVITATLTVENVEVDIGALRFPYAKASRDAA